MKDFRGKILIVDDDVLDTSMVTTVLKRANYDTEHAPNGLIAMDMLQRHSYDLVLLDIQMPKMNGYDVCKAMRNIDSLMEVPVLFLTGINEPDSIVQAFEAGAQDYISKPFNCKELLIRVETHIKLKHQTDELREINRILESNNRTMFESISYARYLQESMFPSVNQLNDSIDENFILYQPKDIVSGDFFWYRRFNNLLYIAAADCTGHGVPGAFMSMLGIAALNQIVTKRSVNNPGYILAALRKKIISALNPYKKETENSNGLDIAFCMIDFEQNTLEFAGANCPLYYISKKDSDDTMEPFIKKPNHMPIGLHPRDHTAFTNHKINLKKGDQIYIFSDGYKSQFGGENDKKLGSKRFRQLIYSVHDKPMAEQKKALEKSFQAWKGTTEQVDDVLVIGLRYNPEKQMQPKEMEKCISYATEM